MIHNGIGGGEQPGEPSSFRGDQRQTGLGVETVGTVVDGEAMKQLCLWPADKCSIQSLWAKLRAVLGEDSASVRKVVEVRQRENVSRFDLLVDLDNWARVLTSLRRAKHQHRWWVREHVNYYRRIRTGGIGNLPQREAGKTRLIKASTWNIHFIASKRQEIELYLKMSGVKLLGLQETYRGIGDWPIYLHDYQVFESIAEGGRARGLESGRNSQNGLALVIHKSLVAYEFGLPSPYMIGAKVMIGKLEWIVLNVYLPPRGYAARKIAISAVRQAVQTAFARDLGARLLIMGDWNTDPDGVSKLLDRWQQPLELVGCTGSAESFRGPRRWTAIDHFVVSSEFNSLTKKAKVNRSWDLSDHWPVELAMKGCYEALGETTGVESGEGVRVDVSMLEGKKQEIISHNVWHALLDLEDTDLLDDLPTLLEAAVKVVADDTEVKKASRAAGAKDKPTYRLSKKAKKAILRRRKAHLAWAELGEPLRGGPLWTRYLVLKERAQRLKRASMKQSWIRHIELGSKKVSDNDLGASGGGPII